VYEPAVLPATATGQVSCFLYHNPDGTPIARLPAHGNAPVGPAVVPAPTETQAERASDG
jgi:hypothetical protein